MKVSKYKIDTENDWWKTSLGYSAYNDNGKIIDLTYRIGNYILNYYKYGKYFRYYKIEHKKYKLIKREDFKEVFLILRKISKTKLYKLFYIDNQK